MKARRRVVTQGKGGPGSRGAANAPAPKIRRTPTVRTFRSAILEPRPASASRAAVPIYTADFPQ